MDRRRPSERSTAASPLPKPTLSTPSHLFRDVSNLKTPRPYSRNPNPNPSLASPSLLFFTASKKTPYSSYSTPISPASHSTFRHRTSSVTARVTRSKTAQRLKSLELEQSRSARRAHVRRDKILESFARSLTSWLNILLQNPKDCGCKVGSCAADGQPSGSFSKGKGKRESLDGGVIEIGSKWRSPKRQRVESEAGIDINFSLVKQVPLLKKSLYKICSLEDMLERMMSHISSKSCNEVLLTMSQLCKNIDEGRLKMKPCCPLVTDLAIREKAIKVLMCYNTPWLQIGLHILFGGDSLLFNHGDQDEHFLKEFIAKHFLTHVGIARTHALNKLVGGLYRPGYYEALGSIILKRFLLLAIVLDRAKCESSLPIKHGIDSVDGGSPLLFTHHSHIKSSRHIIHEFLMDSMHGEGDLLAHLVILGCKVNYQQSPLCEREFKVKNIFEDLQDGILLCRVVQLLLCNQTILSKVVCPSDAPKKKLQNCSAAMQYLKDSGVQMSDSDGVIATAADIANGDRELTCSILWNVFVHLQVPLLISRTSLFMEIANIKGSDAELLKNNSINEMNLLLHWTQAVCVTQNIDDVHSFSSLTDGRALTCLIKFYLGNDINQLIFEKENEDEHNDQRIRLFNCLSPTLLDIAFVQSVTAMLGKSPEVLRPCDIFDEDSYFDERSAAILLVFLASRLINADKLDIMNSVRFSQQDCQSSVPRSRNNLKESFCPHNDEGLGKNSPEEIIHKIKRIQIWWRGLMERRHYLQLKCAAFEIPGEGRHATVLDKIEKESAIGEENKIFELQWRAATKIQECWKTCVHNTHLKRCCSAIKIQSQWRCRSIRKKYLCQVEAIKIIQSAFLSWMNHKLFQQKQFAAIEIQRFIRGHLTRTKLLGASNLRFSALHQRSRDGLMNNFELRIFIGSIIKLQRWWKRLQLHRSRMHAAISIQSSVRGWVARRSAAKRKQSISVIQRLWRNMLLSRMMKSSAIAIQACIRGWITRLAAAHKKCCVLKIQSYWKGYLVRKQSRPQLLNLRQRMKMSSANVSDEMRLINRLVVALSELLGHTSVSNIRHTCSTLDTATELSQKCCETLVDAGAIDILLKQIKLLNRGIPDQEVLKHVLSTLRNIVRYNHLSQVLINTPRSIEIIFQEMLRNKNEGFLISCQLLRRVCTVQEGLQAVRKLRGHVKRLNNVVVGLERKAKFLERNAHLNNQRNLTVRRLREAFSLLSLIVDSNC